MRKTLIILLAGLMVGGLAQKAQVQMSSPNYQIPRQAFSGSGGGMSSAGFTQQATIAGQSTPIGVAGSAGFENFAGYLYGSCGAARGDFNADGLFSSPDFVLFLGCAFVGSGYCALCFSDMNCDGVVSSSDGVILLNLIFLGTPPPC